MNQIENTALFQGISRLEAHVEAAAAWKIIVRFVLFFLVVIYRYPRENAKAVSAEILLHI